MKKSHIALIVIVVLVAGALLVFGNWKKAEAPANESLSSDNQVDISNSPNLDSVQAVPTSNIPNGPTKMDQGEDDGASKEFVVQGENFSLSPKQITVKKGDKVKITFKNVNGFHNLIIDEFNVGTKSIQGGAQESVEFVADKTGSFQYYCSVGTHRAMGMWGTLVVE